jgi:hypothetical protein
MAFTRFDRQRRWLLGALSASAASLGAATTPPSRRRFRVFDALLHPDRPNLTRHGLEPIATPAPLSRPGESHDVVDLVEVALALERVPADANTIFIDIEEWPLIGVSPAARDDSIGKYKRIAEFVRNERPTLQFGFYGVVPVGAYWPIMFRNESYQQWLAANRAVAPLARLVDFLFPSLYTAYDDRAGWLKFAGAQIDAAQQYGNPVYPFLWFEYFDGNEKLRGQDVAAAAWEEELRFCRAHADGVVLWGGYQRRWNDQAVWWQTVLRVLDLPVS